MYQQGTSGRDDQRLGKAAAGPPGACPSVTEPEHSHVHGLLSDSAQALLIMLFSGVLSITLFTSLQLLH